MKKNNFRVAYLFISISFLFFMLIFLSCKNEVKDIAPEIKLKIDTATIWKDTVLHPGHLMNFEIEASSGEIPITNLVISLNNGTEQVFLDTGMYTHTLRYKVSINKGISQKETWTFMVMNEQRQKSFISVTIHLLPGTQFGEIDTVSMITIGAQGNTTTGSFFSIETQQTYFLEQAYGNQALIDMIYYYDIYESTLSSPAENDVPSIFTGTFGISNWSIRNESRYNLTQLSGNDFDAASNDSLLIVSYDPVNAKRKGKFAKPGDVWAFRNQHGKLGLLYIHSITGSTQGQMVCSVKIQK